MKASSNVHHIYLKTRVAVSLDTVKVRVRDVLPYVLQILTNVKVGNYSYKTREFKHRIHTLYNVHKLPQELLDEVKLVPSSSIKFNIDDEGYVRIFSRGHLPEVAFAFSWAYLYYVMSKATQRIISEDLASIGMYDWLYALKIERSNILPEVSLGVSGYDSGTLINLGNWIRFKPSLNFSTVTIAAKVKNYVEKDKELVLHIDDDISTKTSLGSQKITLQFDVILEIYSYDAFVVNEEGHFRIPFLSKSVKRTGISVNLESGLINLYANGGKNIDFFVGKDKLMQIQAFRTWGLTSGDEVPAVSIEGTPELTLPIVASFSISEPI